MRRKLVIGIGILGLLLAACVAGQEEEAPEAAGRASEGEAFPEEAPAAEPELDVAAEEAAGSGVLGGLDLPAVGPSVIKTADVRLQVARGGFKEALQSATQVATAHGGFVVSSTVEGEDARRGSLVIRVPAAAFEQALNAVRDLGEVKRDVVSTQDVSQEFVDLEARRRNLEAQEAVLLRLMDESQTVSDAIKVQRELTGVQLEIEQITGRLRFLEDQTAFGTISIALFERGVGPAPKPNALQRGWSRATDAFLTIVSGLVASLGVVVPLGLAALVVWLVIRRTRPVRTP